jgi:hypothetical protein
MKQFLIGLISVVGLTLTTPAMSQHRHGIRHYPGHVHNYHVHRHWHPHYGWVIPAVVGGTVVWATTRPNPIIVQTQPTRIESNQLVIDGVLYEKQIMNINGVEQEVFVRVVAQATTN